MKEKERKFFLNYLPDEIDNLTPQIIEQGYLLIVGGKQLRVRLVDKGIELGTDVEAWICYKSFISDSERDEFEYNIPVEDAVTLLESTEIKLQKKRYKLNWNGFVVDIDIYKDLMVVEIEGEGVDEINILPPYFGPEITGIKQYSNIALAQLNANRKNETFREII